MDLMKAIDMFPGRLPRFWITLTTMLIDFTRCLNDLGNEFGSIFRLDFKVCSRRTSVHRSDRIMNMKTRSNLGHGCDEINCHVSWANFVSDTDDLACCLSPESLTCVLFFFCEPQATRDHLLTSQRRCQGMESRLKTSDSSGNLACD